MIDLCDVTVEFPRSRSALCGVTLHVSAGDFLFLVGPTGAGKSTLLKLIYREIVPTSGTVLVNNQNVATLRPREVPFLRRRMGVVFQDIGLLPNKTVFENVAFALRVIGAGRREIRHKVPFALDRVGMTHRCDAFPGQLSGGEQQRVAIARALVNDPPLLLADEPTGNLDPETSLGIAAILDEVNANGTTVLMATHDKEVVNVGRRRVVELELGRIVRDEVGGAYMREQAQCV